MDFYKRVETKYKEILTSYIQQQTEQPLYLSEKLSKELLEHHVSPEEVISVHRNMLREIMDVPDEIYTSFDILLEIMMSYGLAYREHQSLRNKQMELRMELEIGAKVQKTLLGTKIPKLDFLDIGAISVPAKIMNGDYYHFVTDSRQSLKVAIADIIGKGIPAALCMSMIKFAMDSLKCSSDETPNVVLENINRIIEQNLEQGMFITMFYGSYNPSEHHFQYASAGHEPGFFYNCKLDEFSDLDTKGLILGVDKNVTYPMYEKNLEVGDMIVLLSDGVTETRINNGFLEREMISKYIKKYIHLSAQEIVNNIYKELERLQEFKLRDDFTLIILRRKV
ncbi:PP2C family protein-serine/threonine phosphatase [Bacillus kwashiorkori]|uniref:PP2C family protein-serine/threonine phosphatase n=1 Tax=Bacillus kwashiorkori TaxID=1522318 RepID=UPI0007820950|nr:PP2C family protein-serine/threonine phosphatase [Bacillus kwashiorkori]